MEKQNPSFPRRRTNVPPLQDPLNVKEDGTYWSGNFNLGRTGYGPQVWVFVVGARNKDWTLGRPTLNPGVGHRELLHHGTGGTRTSTETKTRTGLGSRSHVVSDPFVGRGFYLEGLPGSVDSGYLDWKVSRKYPRRYLLGHGLGSGCRGRQLECQETSGRRFVSGGSQGDYSSQGTKSDQSRGVF